MGANVKRYKVLAFNNGVQLIKKNGVCSSLRMGANVKRTWLEVGLRPPKHSHCSVSSLLNLTINTIAIDYSGIKFYTSNGYEFTVCTQ